jgi:predicted nucleic acid-binding protein
MIALRSRSTSAASPRGLRASTGTVQICAPADDVEQALYVEFALVLGDGEALALAIAKNRGWKMATDDRKARNKAEVAGVDHGHARSSHARRPSQPARTLQA